MTERNISEIAKAEHLVKTLDKEIAEAKAKCDEWAQRFLQAPLNALEWGRDVFAMAAEHEILSFLRDRIMHRAETDDPKFRKVEWTVEELRQAVWDKYRFKSPIPRSSSATANLVEQHLLAMAVDFAHGDGFRTSWFWLAQREDAEYQAWDVENSKVRAREQAAREFKKREAEKLSRKARRDVRKALDEGRTPNDHDLINGWCHPLVSIAMPNEHHLARRINEACERQKAAIASIDAE